jgi:putative resolvase
MLVMLHEGLTTGQAAKYISRHPKTLQVMDRTGVLPARRTATGRRYWLRRDLDRYLGRTGVERPRRTVCYCRVSSQAQRPDLKNQRRIVEEFAIARGIANLEFIAEVGGGLNFQRPKFTALVDALVADELAMLVVAHQDRLARFGFELLEHLCRRHGCELLVLNTEKVSPEQEMVQDLLAITHCFSSRLHGLGNYRRALKEALK